MCNGLVVNRVTQKDMIATKPEKHSRSITAAVSVEFTFSSGVKTIGAAHAPPPGGTAAAGASGSTTAAPHWSVADGPEEEMHVENTASYRLYTLQPNALP